MTEFLAALRHARRWSWAPGVTILPPDLSATLVLVGGFGLLALAVGVLAVTQPLAAAVLVISLAVGTVVVARATVLPALLVFTMFIESLALGPGLRIGRLAAVLALAVCLYYLLAHGRAGLRANMLLFAIGAYGVWTLLSVYWADNAGLVYDTTFRYLLAFAYMLTFALLVRSQRQLLLIFGTLAFGAFVFGVISFAGYASAESYDQLVRAKGLQGDFNFFALYEVVALPAALTVAALERRPGRALLFYGVVAAIVLSVVASLSRSGLIELTAVVLATLLVPYQYFFRHAGQKLAYTLSLVAAAGIVVLAGAAPFVRRALTIFHEQGVQGARGSGRLDLWRAAWHRFREDPLLGMGAGNFRGHTFELLQATPGVTTTTGFESKGKYIHNMYLGNLTELGIIGFALFVLVLGLTVWYLLASLRRSRSRGDGTWMRFSAALLASLLGVVLSGFFLSIELAKPLWIIVGLALAVDVVTRRDSPERVPGT